MLVMHNCANWYLDWLMIACGVNFMFMLNIDVIVMSILLFAYLLHELISEDDVYA